MKQHPEPRRHDPSTDTKAVFSTIQPDAPSPIPQAGKGTGHRRRAIIIAVAIVLVIGIAFAVYYALTLGDQSA